MSDEGAQVSKKVKLIDRLRSLWMSKWSKGIIITLCAIVILLPLFFYARAFPLAFSRESDDWGNFGSFAGGIYGSIFSFLTIIYLLIVNRKEREESREQAELQENRFREQISVERMKRDSEYIFDLIERHDLALNQALNNEDQRKNRSYMLFDIYSLLEKCANGIMESGLKLKCEQHSNNQLNTESESNNIRKAYGDYWIRFSRVNKIFCFTETYLHNASSNTIPELIDFWHYNLDPQEVMILAILFGYDESSRNAFECNMGPILVKKYVEPSIRLHRYCAQYRD